jgi:serine/threonine protein kinase/tetratricopeptide (TPR) repeat protein
VNERDIFLEALEKGSPDERRSFLDRTCGDDAQLRTRLELLLKSHEEADSLLDHPVLGDGPTEAITGLTDRSRREPSEDDTIVLDFLEPSDQPESLGRLGQYDMREVVGRGGMGIVLKAHDTKLSRVVAVKVLAPELAANATARKRFLREARAAAAVSHDHVVTIYAVEENEPPGTRGGPPYLVMELIDGQSLEQKIDRDGHLELKEILRIGRQIAAGLAAAHEQGLIHRDIKPSNILLQNSVERVQITDFGLARAADDVGITRTGEIAGTPQYMSPEQAEAKPVDARSDLFNLGSVLYAMCTGRSPFRAETTMASLKRVCEDTPRPIREINPDVPEWLCAITDRLLEKDPDDRFQSAEEVCDLLGECLAHVQDPAVNPLPASLPAKGADRRRRSSPKTAAAAPRGRRWAVAAAVLIGVLALVTLSEATGVTNLAVTVIRIATGEGTLVIEVDDPTVQVSLDGEELSIRGAGLQEIKLRPGQYQFQAIKDGQPVKQELVTITRGDRQVVKVRLESPTITTTAEPSDFVILGSMAAEVRRAQTHVERGNYDEAARAWIRALELAPEGQWDLPTYELFSPLVRHDGAFAEVVSLRPDDFGELWSSRGNYLARHNRWPEAAACFQKRLDVGPARANIWWQYALVLLALDDEEGYRSLCERMLTDFQDNPYPLELRCAAWVTAIAPNAVKDKHAAVRLAQNALSGIPDSFNATHGCGTYGACLYRAGRYEDAVRELNRSEESRKQAGPRIAGAYYCCFLAMAHQRLGNVEEARRWAKEAYDLKEDLTHDAPWFRRVTADRLIEEMDTVLGAKEETTSQTDDDAPVGTTKPEAVEAEKDAFVVLAGDGAEVANFDTLAEAVVGSTAGDTIEIRGNGPFITDPIEITYPLTIRAGSGCRPVIRANPEKSLSFLRPLLAVRSALVMEGLELQVMAGGVDHESANLVVSWAPLQVANCRFLLLEGGGGDCIWSSGSGVVRNCELIRPRGGTFDWLGTSDEYFVIENCVLVGMTLPPPGAYDSNVSLRLSGNTMMSSIHFQSPLGVVRRSATEAPLEDQPSNRVRIVASRNIVDSATSIVTVFQPPHPQQLSAAEAGSALLRLMLEWREVSNLYRSRNGFLRTVTETGETPIWGEDLEDWNRFWELTDTGSTEGLIRYQGGDLHARSRANPEQLTPEDFRLRPDSAGYRAGLDGKDLGADVDLVGPGEAYERWKQTPEYQEWQQQTRELMQAAVADQPDGAAVSETETAASEDDQPPIENPENDD